MKDWKAHQKLMQLNKEHQAGHAIGGAGRVAEAVPRRVQEHQRIQEGSWTTSKRRPAERRADERDLSRLRGEPR